MTQPKLSYRRNRSGIQFVPDNGAGQPITIATALDAEWAKIIVDRLNRADRMQATK